MEVLSADTNSHLALGARPFMQHRFSLDMRQQIFGQDAAITMLGQNFSNRIRATILAGPFVLSFCRPRTFR